MDDESELSILPHFGINPQSARIEKIGTGHINKTFKIAANSNEFVLQRINIQVFKKPEIIASNLAFIAKYLSLYHPQFLFLACLPTTEGKDMHYGLDGYPWRLYPCIPNTMTIDKVEKVEMAFEAACGFGALTKNMMGIEISNIMPTIDRFNDLAWRWKQFQDAFKSATAERIHEADNTILNCQSFSFLVETYKKITRSGQLKAMVTHNDTKINNILFDRDTGKAVCVIDLDTMMPGHFIYDLGDMVRTFVSPVSEEETDLSKVEFRKDYYDALLDGYMSQMKEVLSKEELNRVSFAGKMMTYIMALRFLADFLNGDVYYQTTYPGQNLVRARNQLRLLRLLQENLK